MQRGEMKRGNRRHPVRRLLRLARTISWRRKEETKAASLAEWYVSSRNTLTAYRFLVAISMASRLILAPSPLRHSLVPCLCPARRPLPVARIPPDFFFCHGIPRKCRWPYKLGEKLGERELRRNDISTNSPPPKRKESEIRRNFVSRASYNRLKMK